MAANPLSASQIASGSSATTSLLGRESTVRSNVNLSLALAYSKQSGETRQVGVAQSQLPVNRDRLAA